MTTTHDSQACCDTPVPTATVDYTPKGTYKPYAETKCYITGPASADEAIFFIYDIFGFRTPTLQGADMLANAGYLVIMPDFFKGDPADPEWAANQTEENKKKFGEFLGRIKDPSPILSKIDELVPVLEQAYPSVSRWASIGFCWGGKLVSLTSASPSTKWTVGVQSSPAQVDPEDAKKISIPMMVLASEGEDAEIVEKFGKALGSKEKVVERFGSQVHGWMSARADLGDEGKRRAYEEGWGMVLDFLGKYF